MSRNSIGCAMLLVLGGSLAAFTGCGNEARQTGAVSPDAEVVGATPEPASAVSENGFSGGMGNASPAERSESSSFAADDAGSGASPAYAEEAAGPGSSDGAAPAPADAPAPTAPSSSSSLEGMGDSKSTSPRMAEGKKKSTRRSDAGDEIIRPEEEASSKRSKMAAGLLTAGSFDDHERFDEFMEFLARSQQNDPSEVLPRMAVGQRALIHVHNGQGEPLSNAKISVAAKSDPQRVLMKTKTGSDGRALFASGRHAEGVSSTQFLVSVQLPQQEPITKTMDLNQSDWRIEVTEAAAARPQQLDLALVIDATGSMGDELNYLKIEIDHIASTVKKMFPNVDQRFSLIVYRDAGDAYVTRVFDFTSSLSDFRSTLAKQSAAGGGDYPEAMHLAMENAGQLSWRDGNTARVMFLIGDAPPHDRDAARAIKAAEKLRQQNVRVFPVAASGAAWKAEYILRSTAFLTMGQYLFLTDHSGVGNPHAAPHVPDYQVEHLNRLMVRMVAQELAGKKLVPQEVIAIERGDASPLQFQPIRPLAQQVDPQQQASYEPVLKCGVPDMQEVKYSFTLDDLPVDRLTIKWIAYGLAICGIIFLGSVATRG